MQFPLWPLCRPCALNITTNRQIRSCTNHPAVRRGQVSIDSHCLRIAAKPSNARINRPCLQALDHLKLAADLKVSPPGCWLNAVMVSDVRVWCSIISDYAAAWREDACAYQVILKANPDLRRLFSLMSLAHGTADVFLFYILGTKIPSHRWKRFPATKVKERCTSACIRALSSAKLINLCAPDRQFDAFLWKQNWPRHGIHCCTFSWEKKLLDTFNCTRYRQGWKSRWLKPEKLFRVFGSLLDELNDDFFCRTLCERYRKKENMP